MARTAAFTALALVGVALVGVADHITGPEIGFSLFYLAPIGLAAWTLGRIPGIVVAIAAALSWAAADVLARGGPSVLATSWNGLTRLVIFIAIAVLLDRQRASAARLLEVDRQRNQFLRVVEHELPPPVERIAGLAERLGRVPLEDANDRAAVRELRQRAMELRFFARDFISLGQLGGGRIALAKTSADLNQLVRDAVQRFPEKDRVIITLGAVTPLVEADHDRMRQAIESVVRSALQSSPEYVNVSVRSDPDFAWVDVTDRSRVPLRADDTPRLAGAQTAVDPRAAELAERFLGLQLARVLVEAHDGSLVIESPSTLASVVRIKLPRVRSDPLPRIGPA